MMRTEVNPWEWSRQFGFSQAVQVAEVQRLLVCSGQTAIAEDGSPPTKADMSAQVRMAFANLGAVLSRAGLGAADVVRVTYYTTDVDELIAVMGPLAAEFFGPALPASTLLGVTRLALPQLRVEIEAIAAS